MKKILAIALLTTSLAVSAQALIVGASVGYLTDAKDAYSAVRIGSEFSSTDTLAHIGEFEIGYSTQSDSGVKADFMPVTINYRAQFTGNSKIGSYAGFGAGMARTKVSGYFLEASDWSFAVQGFAGVSFKVAEKTYLDLGARYVWIDSVKLQGMKVSVGDDLSLECGLHFKF